MDHLSSCYFCGAALDDTIQDYRVVPVELREDDAVATVTLCSSCHAKVERLLGPVVEAAGESGATLDACDASVQVSGSGREATDAADPHTEGQDREQHAGADSEVDPPVGETGPDETVGDDELIEIDDELDEDPLSPAGTGEPAAGDGDDAGVEGEDVTDDAGSEDGKTETSGEATTRTTVSALEYNKVMRLLQNREFPVDRAEIQTVAANAYGLAEHECAEVIDLAIDRGLIAEHDGQLVRPE
ncbi:MAG: hypothetical protein V5A39_09925 [Haloarculaceae archaeon]